MNLEECRREIDRIDDAILKLFQERMGVVSEVAELKKKSGTAVTDRKREREILRRVFTGSGKLGRYALSLFNNLMEVSRAYQRELSRTPGGLRDMIAQALSETPEKFPESAVVACMGREGTFGQEACDRLFKVAEILYFRNFAGVFQAVEQGLCDYGVIPVDNTTSGTVEAVYDLMQHGGFHVVRSVNLQVANVLLAPKGSKLADVKEVFSHEQPFRQCSEFLKKELPQAKLTVCESTAGAAVLAAESGRRDVAALASRRCAELCGLEILRGDVQNSDYNYTRFLCIGRKLQIFPNAEKTSLIAVLPHQPGALYNIVAKFAAMGVNLTKLESRPIAGRKFEYRFYFDFEASVRDPGVVELLDEIAAESEKFLFLGNYAEL